MFKRLLVTGGAGFIGSAFIRHALQFPCECILNLDLLTYAADLRNLEGLTEDARYIFVQGNICNEELVKQLCTQYSIDAIVHFAAESHVDRSILGPKAFYETNVGGTLSLLEVLRELSHIHLHHISTDEVYGSLCNGYFTELSSYQPNSPYAASKAASDHFVRAYAHTYGLSMTMSHCTNNYGPGQNVEKFIPRMVAGCYHRQILPVYGAGKNVRDWIFVEDHVAAVWLILQCGQKGQVYDVGGECERTNLELLQKIVEIFAELTGESIHELLSLITYVPDRLGHDFRYAIDCGKIKRELGWKPQHTLEAGLCKTLEWYLQNPDRLQLETYPSMA